MTMISMSITDRKKPSILNSCQVLLYYKVILISLAHSWNSALSRFHSVLSYSDDFFASEFFLIYIDLSKNRFRFLSRLRAFSLFTLVLHERSRSLADFTRIYTWPYFLFFFFLRNVLIGCLRDLLVFFFFHEVVLEFCWYSSLLCHCRVSREFCLLYSFLLGLRGSKVALVTLFSRLSFSLFLETLICFLFAIVNLRVFHCLSVRIFLIFVNWLETLINLLRFLLLLVPWRQTFRTFVKMAAIENLMVQYLIDSDLVIIFEPLSFPSSFCNIYTFMRAFGWTWTN